MAKKAQRSNYVPWKTRLEADHCLLLTTQGFNPIETYNFGTFDFSEYDILKRTDSAGRVVYIEPCTRRNGSWRVTHCCLTHMRTETFDLEDEYAQHLLVQASNWALFNTFTPELID